jgi:hypothetical protein
MSSLSQSTSSSAVCVLHLQVVWVCGVWCVVCGKGKPTKIERLFASLLHWLFPTGGAFDAYSMHVLTCRCQVRQVHTCTLHVRHQGFSVLATPWRYLGYVPDRLPSSESTIQPFERMYSCTLDTSPRVRGLY